MGRCTVASCMPGFVMCSGVCTDTQRDARNCGICAMACPSGQVCDAGRCVSATRSNVVQLALGVIEPTYRPHATEHIPGMIEIIGDLVAKGAVRDGQLVKVLGNGELSVALTVTANAGTTWNAWIASVCTAPFTSIEDVTLDLFAGELAGLEVDHANGPHRIAVAGHDRRAGVRAGVGLAGHQRAVAKTAGPCAHRSR